VSVVFSTGSPVKRVDSYGRAYWERLAVTPEALDLSRLNDGAPVLDMHQALSIRDQLGSVVPGSARIEGAKGSRRCASVAAKTSSRFSSTSGTA
jgi:hypothetical protein